jgi:hypothetical protein
MIRRMAADDAQRVIRRMIPPDAEAVSEWLGAQFAADPTSGGVGKPSEDGLRTQAQEGVETWVCEENGALLGVLGPRMRGQAERTIDGKKRIVTFDFYNRLVVDTALRKTSRNEAGRIAAELTMAAFEEVRDKGDLQDFTRAEGLTKSEGAAWLRLLGFKEEVFGDYSVFWLESKLIGEAVQATGFLK